MIDRKKVALPVIKRLPRYYRYICDMLENGTTRVSSTQLARQMGSTASQVRQDFNCFGGFGQQGVGYSVEMLHKAIGELMLSGDLVNTVLIGAGSLGHTLAAFLRGQLGENLCAAFDVNPQLIGTRIGDKVPVYDTADFQKICAECKPKLAIICVHADVAQQLVPLFLAAGINAFWNFSSYDFTRENPAFIVENVHLGDSLLSLQYQIKANNL